MFTLTKNKNEQSKNSPKPTAETKKEFLCDFKPIMACLTQSTAVLSLVAESRSVLDDPASLPQS